MRCCVPLLLWPTVPHISVFFIISILIGIAMTITNTASTTIAIISVTTATAVMIIIFTITLITLITIITSWIIQELQRRRPALFSKRRRGAARLVKGRHLWVSWHPQALFCLQACTYMTATDFAWRRNKGAQEGVEQTNTPPKKPARSSAPLQSVGCWVLAEESPLLPGVLEKILQDTRSSLQDASQRLLREGLVALIHAVRLSLAQHMLRVLAE